MNDEIKEILECLKIALNSESYEVLLDYITNLQQENKYLKKQNDEKTKIGLADHKYASQMEDKVIELQQDNERLKDELKYTIPDVQHNQIVTKLAKEKNDYKSRCEKAIEYIKGNTHTCNYVDIYNYALREQDLLNILQNGSEK